MYEIHMFECVGKKFLCEISKVTFEIPHKISCPYIERWDFIYTLNFMSSSIPCNFSTVPSSTTDSYESAEEHIWNLYISSDTDNI